MRYERRSGAGVPRAAADANGDSRMPLASGGAARHGGQREGRLERASQLNVRLFPTPSWQAGISMGNYASQLIWCLRGLPGVRAEAVTAPWMAAAPATWLGERWLRYVTYPASAGGFRADVYHVVDHSNAQLLLALPPRRVVVTCHDLYPLAIATGTLRFPGAERRVAMFATALRLRLLRRAAAVICDSEHTLVECRRYLGIPWSRMHVVPLGLSREFVGPCSPPAVTASREALGLREGEVVVLHVGGNDPRKNVRTVLRVVARLRESSSYPVRLIKVGKRLGKAEREVVRALRLEGAVLDLGPVDARQLVNIYHAATVLLYPSFHEGFCWPVLEAMACGLPVIASRLGAIPEIASGAAILCEPTDVAAMARSILEVLRSPSRREATVAAGRQLSKKYTMDKHARQVLEVYRAVAAAADVAPRGALHRRWRRARW